jgi:hypothetical protein
LLLVWVKTAAHHAATKASAKATHLLTITAEATLLWAVRTLKAATKTTTEAPLLRAVRTLKATTKTALLLATKQTAKTAHHALLTAKTALLLAT